MKLKCDRHNRRALSGKDSFLHRTGDMSPCDSSSATMNDSLYPEASRTFSILNGKLVPVA